MAAGQEFKTFDQNFGLVLQDVRTVRGQAEDFADAIAPAVAAANAYSNFRKVVEISDTLIDKTLDSLRLAEKAGPLSAPSRALKEVLQKIEPRIDSIKKATDDAELLNDITDIIEFVDEQLTETILPNLEATDLQLTEVHDGVGEIVDAYDRVSATGNANTRRDGADRADALFRETDDFVRPINVGVEEGYKPVRDAFIKVKDLMSTTLDFFGYAEFEKLADAFKGLLEFEGLIDVIDNLTDVVDVLLRPIEPLLDLVDAALGFLVDPVLNFITETLGIDKIFDEIAAALDPLFPKVEIFDGISGTVDGLNVGQKVLDDLQEFDVSSFGIPDVQELAKDTFDIFAAEVDGPPLRIGDIGNQTIFGTGGNEAFDPRGGNDEVRANAGDDIIVASAGNDTIYGGDGVDRIVFAGELVEYDFTRDDETGAFIFTHTDPGGHGFNEGSEVVFDVEYFDFGTEFFTDEQLANAVLGQSVLDRNTPNRNNPDGDELIFLQNGGQRIDVSVMWEQNGSQQTSQFQNVNAVYGFGGNDRIQGSLGLNGRDYIDGGAGDDLLIPRTGNDILNGGTGVDTFQIFDIGLPTQDRIFLNTNSANVREGTMSLFNLENVINLQKGAQITYGNALDNRLVSSWDRDVLVGLQGADLLSGNGREDVLFGGRGADTLFGGDGGDRLIALNTSDNGGAELYVGEAGRDLLSYSSDPGFANLPGDLEPNQRGAVSQVFRDFAAPTGSVVVRVEAGEIDRLDASGNVIATDIAVGIEQFVGSDSNDTLLGAQSSDEVKYDIYGAGGNDRLVTNGATVADGGDGADLVIPTLGDGGLARANNLIFRGGSDSDRLDLRQLGDLRILLNLGNNDTPLLRGWDNDFQGTLTPSSGTVTASFTGFETFFLGAFDDRVNVYEDVIATFFAGDGADYFDISRGSSAKNVTAHGQDGDDSFVIDTRGKIFGGAGNDRIETDNIVQTNDGGRNVLDGGAGDDLVILDRAWQVDVNGGAGFDRLAFEIGVGGITLDLANQVAAGRDSASSTVRDIRIEGFEEYILSERNDVVFGTADADRIILREGSDTVEAGAGNDLIYGGEGRDSILAGAGDDTISGGSGFDTIDGGAGIDAISFVITSPAGPNGERQFELTERLILDLETGRGGRGSEVDIISNVEQIFGTYYNDEIYGDAEDNLLSGENGSDLLDGRGGDDVLIAGGGRFGSGAERLFGGAGNDRLVIGVGRFEADGGNGSDWLDFSAGTDPLNDGGTTTALRINLQSGDLSRDIEEGRAVWSDGGGVAARSYDGQSLTPEDVLRADPAYSREFSDSEIRLPEAEEAVAFGRLAISTELTTRTETSGSSTFSEIENVAGSGGADRIFGDGAANVLEGAAGNDRLRGAGGDDTIDGGAGLEDVAEFSGGFGQYRISLSADGHEITDKRGPGGTGSDTIVDIERLAFGDGASFVTDGLVDVTSLEGVADLEQAQLRYFVEMYIAYFDRAPDSLGLFYWGDRLADGMGLTQIARSFFVQDESREAFPDPNDNEKLVFDAYNNLLERDPDAEGRDFWIGELENGNVSRAEFMLALINGAKAETGSAADVRTLEQKADIGVSYAVINGLNDVGNARSVMEAYDRTSAQTSLETARVLIEGYAAIAEQSDSDEIVVGLSGVADDPFG